MSLAYTLDDLKVLGGALSHATPGALSELFPSSSSNIADNIFGINHRQIPTAIPKNRDRYGLTFFTRPQLNLTKDNLRNVRLMSPLLTNSPTDYPKVIRSALDPRMQIGWGRDVPKEECTLVDNQQAFIPFLTNNIRSISGWKDIEVPFFSAKAGAYREDYSMVDGLTVDYTTYTLTANFRNMRGDLITGLFYFWAHYMSHVFEGKLMPYPDYLVENMLDYNTRIYRLVLDHTRTKVQGIAATGIATPMAVPIGQKFDFAVDQPYNDAYAEISVPFKCDGICYNDDILIFEFNETVCIFNPAMKDKTRETMMTQIPESMKFVFNHRGYARIDPNDYTLQWWVSNADYNAKMQALEKINSSLGNLLLGER